MYGLYSFIYLCNCFSSGYHLVLYMIKVTAERLFTCSYFQTYTTTQSFHEQTDTVADFTIFVHYAVRGKLATFFFLLLFGTTNLKKVMPEV